MLTHPEMLAVVAHRLNTTSEALLTHAPKFGGTNAHELTWPKQDAMLILSEEYHLSHREIATLFGKSYDEYARNSIARARDRRAHGITLETGNPCRACGGQRRQVTISTTGRKTRVCDACQRRRKSPAPNFDPADPQAFARTATVFGLCAAEKRNPMLRASYRELAAYDQRRKLRLSQLTESERRFVVA